MHQAIYETLQDVARAQGTTTYGAIAPLAQIDLGNPADRNHLADLLGEISRHEHEQGRPMLSAVVIAGDNNMPGQGFFTLARELGLHSGGDDLAFFCEELARVHATWK